MKKHRLITAALCAVGVAAVGAVPASADPITAPPARVLIYDADGFSHAIDCPTPAADPVCQGGMKGVEAAYTAAGLPLAGATDKLGAFRFLDPFGHYYLVGRGTEAMDAILAQVDAAGGPGAARLPQSGEEMAAYGRWVEASPAVGAAGAAKHAKKGKSAKKAVKHRKHARK